MVDELKILLNTPEKLYAAAKLSGAVIKFKQELLADLWDRIESDWESRSKNENSVLKGHLVANKYAENDRHKIKYKSKEYFTKQREVPRYFGFASHSYKFKEIPVGLEIRFNGCFYVGIYGINGEKVLPKSVVVAFYNKYQPPEDCKVAFTEENSDKERILVNTPIRFETDNEAVFKLIEKESQQKFVTTICEVAEGIIKGMIELGLEELNNPRDCAYPDGPDNEL